MASERELQPAEPSRRLNSEVEERAKVRELEALLEEVAPRIPSPRLELEQYTTPAGFASRIAVHARLSGLLEDSVVADLGAGTCRPALARLLLGASKAVAIDADSRFSSICARAAEPPGVSDRMVFANSRVGGDEGPPASAENLVVAMNSPFGVHTRGSDA